MFKPKNSSPNTRVTVKNKNMCIPSSHSSRPSISVTWVYPILKCLGGEGGIRTLDPNIIRVTP